MSDRKTIIVPLESMKVGGAERTVLNLVNHLDPSRYRVLLALYRSRGGYLSQVHDHVMVTPLHCDRPKEAILPLRRLIQREHPHLVFSTLLYNNVAAVLAAGASVPVIVRESNHQTAAGRSRWHPKEWLVRYAYKKATHVVALSQGVRDDMVARYGLSSEHITTIYNPVDLSSIQTAALQTEASMIERDASTLHLVAVGRLERQKGFDVLLRACAILPPSLRWHLTILGEGGERSALESLAHTLGIEARISLPGVVLNPYATMHAADLFVLSSRWEGFGHVIVEAMACGTPVLSTRCPSGPDEIITHDVDGWLVEPENPKALAARIERLILQLDVRRRLSERASQTVLRFSAPDIARQYEALFDSVI